jgi:S-adenosylmethionine:tRNA ribosyltransferase-isomerase
MTMHVKSGGTTAWNLSLDLPQPPNVATHTPETRGLARDEVKLMVLDKVSGERQHATFYQLPQWLDADDVVVVNHSRTLPASLPVRLATDGQGIRIHLAGRITKNLYIVERRTVAGAPDDTRFATGEQLVIDDEALQMLHRQPPEQSTKPQGSVVCTVIGHFHPHSRLWYVECAFDLWRVAEIIGQPIRYGYLREAPDIEAFQTIFARELGSAEMPSAARPFSERVVASLQARGVKLAGITLHTGTSSHEVTGRLTDHPFLPEWYHVSAETAALINEANANHRRVIAVGTTVVRAVESATLANGEVVPKAGWTSLIITPESPPRAVTGLMTGFHDSDTSHLAMLYAFTTQENLRSAYAEAVAKGYLWHEFGDANLIL